jgi:tripartite-type tricarboxylate transporter receptor subunit TctC
LTTDWGWSVVAKRWMSSVVGVVLVLVLCVTAGCSKQRGSSGEPSPAEFYKGKTLTVIVPYNAGGGFDVYARLVQPFLEKYIPGVTVVVQNVPGAGGITGTNQLFKSEPDGLTVGIANIAGCVFAAVTDAPGVAYDFGKFTWLCRVATEPRSVTVSASSPIKQVEDLKRLGREVKVALTGVGSDDYYVAIALFKALGIPMKPVAGYGGQQDCNLAVLRGEVDATVSSLGGVISAIDGGELKPILFVAEKPVERFESVPLAGSLVQEESARKVLDAIISTIELERCFIAPPGLPAARLAFLRDAFGKTFADAEFLAKAKQAKKPIVFLDGKSCEEKAASVWAGAQALKDLIKQEVGK